MNFDDQIRSIRYAIKELHRDRAAAINTKNDEWIKDCDEHINNLAEAIQTIEAMRALEKVFKK